MQLEDQLPEVFLLFFHVNGVAFQVLVGLFSEPLFHGHIQHVDGIVDVSVVLLNNLCMLLVNFNHGTVDGRLDRIPTFV